MFVLVIWYVQGGTKHGVIFTTMFHWPFTERGRVSDTPGATHIALIARIEDPVHTTCSPRDRPPLKVEVGVVIVCGASSHIIHEGFINR